MAARGATETEVVSTIRDAPWESAHAGRREARRAFPFQRSWNGKRYGVKIVRPIFVDEAEEIAVVTVYVYYGEEASP
ncbi:MAG: hypothetical protein K8I02_13240 [Candidatus Methylomirabilis sp.]|nr:hypothetical protein [Deltaproteobacteria bacterium]